MCAYRSIHSHWNRDRPRYVYSATRSSVAEPMSRVRSKPLLDQKRDLDFRFSAQISRSTSRRYYPPTPLICGRGGPNEPAPQAASTRCLTAKPARPTENYRAIPLVSQALDAFGVTTDCLRLRLIS